MLRTQIYLPEELRKEIDKDRAQTGESLAQYVRKAVEERTKSKRKRKADLKKLAQEVVGSSTRSQASALEWVKQIRIDRQLADEKWEKRWDATRKKIKQSGKKSPNLAKLLKDEKKEYIPT